MAQRETPPPKKDVARALLLRGSVFVYLDPRRDDVAVPKWLADQPQLVLQVGLDLPIPIPDLRVDDAGVFGTLSFNRAPFTVVVPWEAVFALWGDDGMGMVWAEDMPPEIAAEVEQAVKRGDPKKKAASKRDIVKKKSVEKKIRTDDLETAQKETGQKRDAPPPHRLRAIEGGASESPAKPSSVSAEPGDGERRLPPYLRVIK